MQQEKNPGEEIRPCLIGGFRCKNVPLRYVHPIEVDDNGRVVTVDMVRVRLVFASADVGEELAGKMSLLPSTDVLGYQSYTSPLRPGRYRVLSTYGMGESSVSLGIGLVSQSGKVDMRSGFVEFNPNKVALKEYEDVFHRWCAKVSRYVKRAELMRWDLAYDVPVARGNLRMEKDRRHYKLEQGTALTEYLGQRNAPGYVKLYDKAAESGLEGLELTRLELTCNGTWTVDDIEGHWPRVYGVRVLVDGLGNTNSLLVGLLADKIYAGGTVEPELKSLDKRMRKKIRDALESLDEVSFPRAAVLEAMRVADMWRRHFEV